METSAASARMSEHDGPWCVVTDPGTEDEYVEATQHATYEQALRWVREARAAGFAADVMKRLPDGSLTTEF